MTRQTKTPRQRAEETLAISDRRYLRAVKNRDKASQALQAAEAEVDDALARLTYAKQDPALSTANTTGGTTA